MTTIVKAIQTCRAVPSQWDAWDSDGNYWYLRYRWGYGTAEQQPGPDISTWSDTPAYLDFDAGIVRGEYDGTIELEDFCDLIGMELQLA